MDSLPARIRRYEGCSTIELLYAMATEVADEALRIAPIVCDRLGGRALGFSVRGGAHGCSGHTILDAGGRNGSQAMPPRQLLVLDDPLPYEAMEAGKVYRSEELIDSSRLHCSAIWRELLEPGGYGSFLCARLDSACGDRAWVTVFRDAAAGRFEEADLEACRELLPHLDMALRLRRRIEEAHSVSDTYDVALEGLGLGVFVVDHEAKILRSNTTADRLLDEHRDLLTVREGRLRVCTPDGRAFGERVRSLLKDGESDRAELLSLVRTDGPPIGLLARPCPGQESLLAGARRGVVFLSDPGSSSLTRADLVGDLFGLSPAEARLAAHIAAGFSLAEAADQLGLSEASARTYSKRIYSKVGVGRQADLVRLLLRSVAPLATSSR